DRIRARSHGALGELGGCAALRGERFSELSKRGSCIHHLFASIGGTRDFAGGVGAGHLSGRLLTRRLVTRRLAPRVRQPAVAYHLRDVRSRVAHRHASVVPAFVHAGKFASAMTEAMGSIAGSGPATTWADESCGTISVSNASRHRPVSVTFDPR